MFSFSLLLTLYAGFVHAFEADHLLGVGNIVSQRYNIWLAIKDGVFWGLGHSSTIFVIGVLMLIFKVGISESSFRYFEAMVGLMLIILAIFRILKYANDKNAHHGHSHIEKVDSILNFSHYPTYHQKAPYDQKQVSAQLTSVQPIRFTLVVADKSPHHHAHKLAYGVGLVHGLAGSGALIVLVLAQMKSPFAGLCYLLTFSAGAIAGMLVAAGLLSVPFSRKMIQSRAVQGGLVILTSLLCLVYGSKIIYQNLIGF